MKPRTKSFYGELRRQYAARQKAERAAMAACERTLLEDPADWRAAEKIARLLLKQEKKRDTLAAYGRAIGIAPKPRLLVARGRLHLQSKKYNLALADADRALAEKPGYRDAVLLMAETLFKARRYDHTVAWCDRFLLRRTWWQLHLYRGLALMDSGREAEALAALNRGLKVAPREGFLHYNKACVLVRLGKTGPALAALGRAIRIRREFADLAVHDPDFEPVFKRRDFRKVISRGSDIFLIVNPMGDWK